MRHITPSYIQDFFCQGMQCKNPCAAPVDMTFTRTLGAVCETGVSMGCPMGAERILLRQEKTVFSEERREEPAAPLGALTGEQLELMLDARKTMDLILQNRSLPLRTDVVLALSYGTAFDPMIGSGARYAYEELDWGYTEQPYRQVTGVVQLQGEWEKKREDLILILTAVRDLCKQDAVLKAHLAGTVRLFEALNEGEYQKLRQRFDETLREREYLFEQLLVYLVHRHFLSHGKTVMPCLKRMAVSFAVIRAMAARLWQETGTLTDRVFTELCWHFARCVEDTPEVCQELLGAFETEEVYRMERLQRLLWN